MHSILTHPTNTDPIAADPGLPPAGIFRPMQPYFLEHGDHGCAHHDFLVQLPRPDLADPAAWSQTEDLRKLSIDLP